MMDDPKEVLDDEVELETEVPNEEAEEDVEDDVGSEDEGDEELQEAEGKKSPDAKELLTPKPTGKASQTIRNLRKAAQEAREETARQRRELDELKQQISRQQAQTKEDPREEAERLALMTSDQRVEYHLAKADRKNQENLRNMQIQMADQADRMAYDAKASVDPKYARYRGEVDRIIETERAKGSYPSREVVLAYVIGQKVLAQTGTKKAEVKKTAAKNLQRQKTRPGDGRGDQVRESSGGGEKAARAKRLENMQI